VTENSARRCGGRTTSSILLPVGSLKRGPAARGAAGIRPLSVVHRVPRLFDLGTGPVEVLAIFQIEADGMI